MRAKREARLLELANAVSGRQAVDWDAALSSASSAERAIVSQLRIVDALAGIHLGEDGTDESDLPAVALDSTVRGGARSLGCWGPLQLLELLGEGGFGKVYRAWDPRLEREVALKMLRASRLDDRDLKTTVIDEGRLLARVRHVNVATVHGVERHDGVVGLWMEYVRGSNLADVVRDQGPFGPREAALIGLDLCRALAAVHHEGVIHRDIKAQNVMRESGGRIVLMDFGAGQPLDEPGRHGLSGTPLYMAPELLRGAEASPASDIYGLGVLLYYLVTCSFPVTAGTVSELRRAHERGEVKRLRDARPDLPDSFVGVVERALAADAGRRYASAGAMEAALAPSVGDAGTAATDATDVTPRGRGLVFQLTLGRFRILLSATMTIALVGVVGFMGHSFLGLRDVERHPAEPLPLVEDEPLLSDAGPVRGLPPIAEDWSSPATATGGPPPVDQAPANEMTPTPALTYSIDATLLRNRGTEAEPVEPGASISVDDKLSLQIAASQKLYFYVLRENVPGILFVLYPGEATEVVPLAALNLPLEPSPSEGLIVVLASPERLADLEREIEAAPRAEPHRRSRLTTRGIVFVRTFLKESAGDGWAGRVNVPPASAP